MAFSFVYLPLKEIFSMRFFLHLLPTRDLLAIRNLRWLLISRLCADLYFYSTTIVLFQQQRGLNFTSMFAMESILSLTILLADIPTSIWADRFGYRRIILLGRLCSIVGMLCFLFAYGFWMFVVANVLGGFAIACNSGCEGTLMYQSLTGQHRERQGKAALTLLRLASTCGLFLGLASGSFIGALSPTLAVGASIVPLLFSLLAVFFVQEQKKLLARLSQHTYRQITEIVKVALKTIRNKPALVVLSITNSAAFAFTNAIFWFNQPYFIRVGIPVMWFGPLMAAAMGLQLLALLRMISLQQYLGTRTMLILSCLLPGIAYIFLTKANQSYVTVALIGCVVAFSSWREPLVNNYFHKDVNDKARATTISALSFIGSFTGIALNPWIGSLVDQGLTITGLGMGIGLLVLCLPILLVIKRQD
jgi:MFS family permease